SIVAFSNLYRRVSKEDRHVSQLDAFEEKRHGERVAEPMRVAPSDGRVGCLKDLAEDAIPTLDRRFPLTASVPEDVLGVGVLHCTQGLDGLRREGTVHRRARLLRV